MATFSVVLNAIVHADIEGRIPAENDKVTLTFKLGRKGQPYAISSRSQKGYGLEEAPIAEMQQINHWIPDPNANQRSRNNPTSTEDFLFSMF
ncbi:hypothetical protein GCM10023184_28500 [Flaviaesturariibacter amylovorans]|uniref:Uncharacterized protein n=1 Tax=Flaviaesturariibacter amylovorans TaxID=1084520 RepID=A0ABP8H4Y3_9BACT